MIQSKNRFFLFIQFVLVITSTFLFADNFFVSTSGSDSLGDGSQTNPWLTITHALASVNGTVSNPHTIVVETGTYSPGNTGEIFPLNMKDYVNLQSAEKSLAILDAETQEGTNGERRLITIDRISQVKIDGFTIKNGWVSYGSFPDVLGGGILIDNATYITISNNIVENNFADEGGGIACDSSLYVLINGNTVSNNLAGIFVCGGIGGGISIRNSKGIISDNVVTNNSNGSTAGGIYSEGDVFIIGNEIVYNYSGAVGAGLVLRSPILVSRNYIMGNQVVECAQAQGGGGIFCSQGIIGGSLGNGNKIYNNSGSWFWQNHGDQMLQFLTNDTIIAQYNYFHIHDPHDPNEVYGNFQVDPYLTSSLSFDSTNLIVIPSPLDFDTVQVNQIKTLLVQFFNVTNSLFDSIEVFDLMNSDSLFLLSKLSFNLGPIGKDSITITFKPDSVGSYLDTLKISTNIGLYEVPVSGVGFDTTTVIDDMENYFPQQFKLSRNYPNPFNPDTFLKYELFKTLQVRLRIFNVLGEEVNELLNTKQAPGVYTVHWNGRDQKGKEVSSGIYFYHFMFGKNARIGKMVLNR